MKHRNVYTEREDIENVLRAFSVKNRNAKCFSFNDKLVSFAHVEPKWRGCHNSQESSGSAISFMALIIEWRWQKHFLGENRQKDLNI